MRSSLNRFLLIGGAVYIFLSAAAMFAADKNIYNSGDILSILSISFLFLLLVNFLIIIKPSLVMKHFKKDPSFQLNLITMTIIYDIIQVLLPGLFIIGFGLKAVWLAEVVLITVFFSVSYFIAVISKSREAKTK